VAGALREIVASGRHGALLDDLIDALHRSLGRPEAMEAIRQKIRNELPTLLRLYRADAYLLKKVAATATGFLDEVRADPAHPFRGELDRIMLSFVDRFEHDPGYGAQLAALTRDVLKRPELGAFMQGLWSNLRTAIAAGAQDDTSALGAHVTRLLTEAGRHLSADPQIRSDINAGMVMVIETFIREHKGGVATFISDQVKGWDMQRLLGVIEVNVGRDLQYIRFNGMLIGGLAGLALHGLEVLLRVG
jgi:uncharacterized membrane-anchored protein YjiN (DUF445 family)